MLPTELYRIIISLSDGMAREQSLAVCKMFNQFEYIIHYTEEPERYREVRLMTLSDKSLFKLGLFGHDDIIMRLLHIMHKKFIHVIKGLHAGGYLDLVKKYSYHEIKPFH